MASKIGERGNNGRTRRNGGGEGVMAELGSLRVKARSKERGTIAKSIRSKNEEHQK